MIIDRVRLAGLESYLRDGSAIDLATSTNHEGMISPIHRGMGISIEGVELLLRADDLSKLMARSELGAKPLLIFTLQKEIYPELYADPYSHRVHTVGGSEDFQRGIARNVRAMEVEGQTTLVSLGLGGCVWVSPMYRLPRPILINAAAWELATSRLTPSDGFEYMITLLIWTDGQDPDLDSPTFVSMAPGELGNTAKPGDVRHRTNLALKDVVAYRVLFKAHVIYDTYLYESQYHQDESRSLGRPLLRAFHLLETIESMYAIYSLHELQARCSEFSTVEVEHPMRTIIAYVDLPALLVENESIALWVNPDFFNLCEAHVDAEVRIRPPIVGDQHGGTNG